MILPTLKTQLETNFSHSSLFVMGVSGGSDSMALLYAFHKLKVNVFVVHVNYGLRGEESDADQELVEGMAGVWGFECCSVRLNPEDAEGNFQNWARDQRYQIFRDLKQELGADAIAIAHHRDDQIETILQKLMRGGGVASWQGLSDWDGELFRPLLTFTKKEILDFCENEAVPFREDASNYELKYARNVLRGPIQEHFDHFFPGWQQHILALSETGDVAEKAIEFVLDSMHTGDGLESEKFAKLDAQLQRAVLKKWIEHESGEGLSRGQLYELAGVVELQVGKSLPVNSKLELVKNRGFITLKKKEVDFFSEVEITRKDVETGVSAGFLTIHIDGEIKEGCLQLDEGRLVWPLTLRQWGKGDKFQPLGMKGTQKVSDHLTNRKILSSHRAESLILTGADGTIYALFFPPEDGRTESGSISELAKITKNTKHTLTITR